MEAQIWPLLVLLLVLRYYKELFLTVNSISHVNMQRSFYVLGELNSEKSGGIYRRERQRERERGERRSEGEWGTCCEDSYRTVSLERTKLKVYLHSVL